jgi:hypothetical protein
MATGNLHKRTVAEAKAAVITEARTTASASALATGNLHKRTVGEAKAAVITEARTMASASHW